MTDTLVYEDLVEAFEHSLLHQLRGHGAAVPYLDTWVPDPDPVRSLLNMLEAAELAGERILRVAVSEATLPSRRHTEVAELSKEFGVGVIEPTASGIVLTVTELGLGQHFRRINPRYRAAIKARLGRLCHADHIAKTGNEIAVSADADGFTLAVSVDPVTHMITGASHVGPDDPIARVMLDLLCDGIRGTPIQEMADHGVQHLMSRLSEAEIARPVKGIVLPQNADPIFDRPLALTRRLLDSYRTATGYTARTNEFSPAPDSAWSRLDNAAKSSAVSALLERVAAEKGYGADTVTLAHIERNILNQEVRVVVQFGPELSAADKPDLARALEQRLKRTLEPRIELYSEELKDKNAIRRL